MRIKFSPLWILLWIIPLYSASAANQKPKLVVLIAIDQFRSDYLTRFENQFLPAKQKNGAPGGFRLLMDKGAYFTNSQTAHNPNVTGVGHATMLTGALPYLHGIVANHWYDEQLKEGYYCTYDPDVEAVGAVKPETRTGRSPRPLLVTTVGDELKNAFGGKPVVAAVAIKDRAAILMGGHRADMAIWYGEPIKYKERGDKSAEWVTSTYYAPDKKIPAWLQKWNQFNYFEKKVPKLWKKLLPEAEYWLSTPAEPAMVGSARGLGKTFPHTIDNAGAFATSPWGNAYTLDTALEMIKGMKLGTHGVPDLLAVSLSSFDALGHNFGPMSAEMQDATLRLDHSLAEFFGGLNKLIPGGLANTIVVLTADHGIQPNPALAEKLRLPGRAFWDEELTGQLNDELRAKFGFGKDQKPVVYFDEDQLSLDHELLRNEKKDLLEVSRAAADWLRKKPYVAVAYAKADVLSGAMAPNSMSNKLGVSVHATRSGDVLMVTRPGHMQLENHSNEGTAHETAAVQDASVPLIFMGSAFKPGRYADEAYLIDLAPTLSTVLGIIPPSGSEGHTLVRALNRP